MSDRPPSCVFVINLGTNKCSNINLCWTWCLIWIFMKVEITLNYCEKTTYHSVGLNMKKDTFFFCRRPNFTQQLRARYIILNCCRAKTHFSEKNWEFKDSSYSHQRFTVQSSTKEEEISCFWRHVWTPSFICLCYSCCCLTKHFLLLIQEILLLLSKKKTPQS